MQTESVESLSEVEVLIVGAGPTGLTLACDLARRGVRVAIVEQATEPAIGSRGKGLQPRTLEVFDDLGVIAPILASGSAYPRMRVHLGFFSLPWRMMEQSDVTPDVPYPNAWLVPQARTEAALAARLAALGVAVRFGTLLSRFSQDAEGVCAELSKAGRASQLRARYLVAADGGRSSVRKALGLRFLGESYEHEAMLVGDVCMEKLSREHWHVWRGKRGVVALCPLPGGTSFQLLAQLSSKASETEPDVALAQTLVTQAAGKRGPRVVSASWLSLYRPNVRMVERYREGRVFLAGDAAHVHPPTGGQGLNTGVQDAYNLGWKLAAVLSGASETLLDTYEEERLPVAAAVLRISSHLFRQPLRAQRRGSEMKQLSLSYHGSSLARDERVRAGKLCAGDRAPDAPCTSSAGARRLFDVTRGPHGAVLCFGANASAHARQLRETWGPATPCFAVSDQPTAPDSACLHDAQGWLRRTYAERNETAVVIRPDGYLGLLTDAPAPVSAVAAYLRSIGQLVDGVSQSSPARGTVTGM
jgi:2-polyprenyl-6-methoxyphenol hydroxylase-like FAD-dependent oxidoreductase